MASIWMDSPVARLVTERPGRAHVFERFGIDFCCDGGKSLKAACAEKGLDPEKVASAIQAADSALFEQIEQDWSRASLAELIDHIIERHHEYLCEALPKISELLGKVVRVHGERHPEIVTVREVFEPLRLDMEQHMDREELGLFPLIKEIEADPASTFEAVTGTAVSLSKEHAIIGNALSRIRELTGEYRPPSDACESYRALLAELQRMEADIHMHVHKENNLLFARMNMTAS